MSLGFDDIPLLAETEEVTAETLNCFCAHVCEAAQLVSAAEESAIAAALADAETREMFGRFLRDEQSFFFGNFEHSGAVAFAAAIEQLRPGEVVLFVRPERNLWAAEAHTESETNRLHIIHLGEVGARLDAARVAQACLRNVFEPFVRGAAPAQGEERPVVHREQLDALQKKLDDLEFFLVQHNPAEKIPKVQLTAEKEVVALLSRFGAAAAVPEDAVRPRLLANLQEKANKWFQLGRLLVKSFKDVTFDSLAAEVEYWQKYHSALVELNRQTTQPEIVFSIELLRQRKKWTRNDLARELELEGHIAVVEGFARAAREIPFAALDAASTVPTIGDAMVRIFEAAKKLLFNPEYSLSRCTRFLDLFSDALARRLTQVLEAANVFEIGTRELDELLAAFKTRVFAAWNAQTTLIKDAVVKGSMVDRTRFSSLVYRMRHARLYDRLRLLYQCREDYENMRKTIAEIRQREENQIGALRVMVMTEEGVRNVWAKHFTTELPLFGLEAAEETAVNAAKRGFDAEIEAQIKEVVARVREMLGAAKNHDEMLRIFERFAALIRVPQVKAAVREYQDALLTRIQDDMHELAARYRRRFEASGGVAFARARSLPLNAGEYVWAEQVAQHMRENVARAEAILGDRLANTVKGQEMQKFYDTFMEKRGKERLLERFESTDFEYAGKLLTLESVGGGLRLRVNMDAKARTALEDFRVVIKQPNGFKAILSKKYHFRRNGWPVYVNALTLIETIRLFNAVWPTLTPTTTKMLAPHLRRVYREIERGFALDWTPKDALDAEGQQYFPAAATAVNALQEEAEHVVEQINAIETIFDELGSCSLEAGAYEQKLEAMQHVVDRLLLRDLESVDVLVTEINGRLDQLLVAKLSEIIALWTDEFTHFRHSARGRHRSRLVTQASLLELQMHGSRISVTPPVQATRQQWLHHFHAQLAIVTAQRRVRTDVYAPGATENETFADLLAQVPAALLANAYRALNGAVAAADQFVLTWLRYQALPAIDVEYIRSRVGTAAAPWMAILTEIKQGRAPFESSQCERAFGAILVDFKTVQSKIMYFYDRLQERCFEEFKRNFARGTQALSEQMAAQRLRLEHVSLGTPAELMDALAAVGAVRQNVELWEAQIGESAEMERLLAMQKLRLPDDCTTAQQLLKESGRLRQTYQAKARLFEGNTGQIREVLAREEEAMIDKLKEIETLWNTKKPFGAELAPREALEVIAQLEAGIQANKDRIERLNETNATLKLPTIDTELLTTIGDESAQLKEVWTLLSDAWNELDTALDTPLLSVNPVIVSQTVERLAHRLDDFPPRLRDHEVLRGKRLEIARLRQKVRILRDIRSEAIKETHFAELLKCMKIAKPAIDVRAADVFALDLEAVEKPISEVVQLAQGEMVLESMLAKVKDFWQAEEFQTANFKGKCALIKDWDGPMNRADEDLAQLNTMTLSQHFKNFEGEVKTWQERVARISAALSVWLDVQRKWVYLQGIFNGSSDIKTQLAAEFERFAVVDREFLAIMKRVELRPRILDAVTNIPELQKTLEQFADALAKAQKGLNEYLEVQRQAFARFYFVGDEDLLEIIGNAQEVRSVQKYFAKMFAGICAVEIAEGNELVAMISKEGENVPFEACVRIADFPRINQWLTELERQMRGSLQGQVEAAVVDWRAVREGGLPALVERYPTQTVLLGFQLYWTFAVEELLLAKKPPLSVEKEVVRLLALMAEEVLKNLPPLVRRRYEQLITELVHKRDVTRSLSGKSRVDAADFRWRYHSRFYLNPAEPERHKRVKVQIGNAEFSYGHEYLGVTERLVQTPLTDKCFFTLTQALWLRMGGAPFGPAGTGKTESVKALGCNLGRFVLVFNCDENFNDAAMGRIFVGLCQVGAWGCFDEFNRLEERILSAVSQQILAIQTALREKATRVDFRGRTVAINSDMGVFVTMNPDYAGRSNLPENLKQLFRQMAMVKPDSVLIAQVMLFSQGFKTAEELSGRVVALFALCNSQLSSQPHYDFGLRALKSVLNSSGNLKRRVLAEGTVADPHSQVEEQRIVLRCFTDTVLPKLIADDEPLLTTLIRGMFPGSEVPALSEPSLAQCVDSECQQRFLRASNVRFMEKVMQLNQILKLQHGVMLVGPAGSGKSAVWRALFASLCRLERSKGEFHVIDPKAFTKDDLYGRLNATTMEWTDGVFTHTLRRICENQRGERDRRQWIVFDGDVDPEWAENLNSVLDDNKLLTLPNGDRLAVPPNVRILFEVESLRYATPATVSRCGMVWFSHEVVGLHDNYTHYLLRLREENFDALLRAPSKEANAADKLRGQLVEAIQPLFDDTNRDSLVTTAICMSESAAHVMEFSRIRVLEAFFALVRKGFSRIIEHDEATFGNYSSEMAVVRRYIVRWTAFALVWAFSGDLKLAERVQYFERLREAVPEPGAGLVWPATDEDITFIDYGVRIEDGEFVLWRDRVPVMDISVEKVTSAELVIPTVDTLRHQEVLCSWLLEHRPFIICGPPGSGKTMTLMSTLKALPDFDMIFINFSSSTTPALVLKQLEHYCEYGKQSGGVVLRPRVLNKWLVIFCDEINLPEEDAYGTQAVITFLRQIAEQRGFWRASDLQWITVERVQFVGACNPPTDAGRHPLAPRFLRHCPLILVDFPGRDSLLQIYGTFIRAMVKRTPALAEQAEPLTQAMVEYYIEAQERFTPEQQAHYIYSPRELTRWKYALNEAWPQVQTLEDLVRVWAHEALRLFEDRLVTADEKAWCQQKVDEFASRFFPSADAACLARPIIYSTYLTKAYQSCTIDALRQYVSDRLQSFREEVYDVQLVLFDEVIEHIVKIDRVLQQPIGHMLLVGASGVGKTTLSRLVSWMNGLRVFQIKAGRNYSLENFEADLRLVMKAAGCRGEKITFIFDESNVLSAAFLERMNALLAAGEVPGLFEGEEYNALVNAYKEAQGGRARESDEEIYQIFTRNVQRNLHIIFTMNPAGPDFTNRAASSPAIFNRCVIDWFGDWPEEALVRVAQELTAPLAAPAEQAAVTDTVVRVHKSVRTLNDRLRVSAKKANYITPRDYLDFIRHFEAVFNEKRGLLREQQGHLQRGVQSINATEATVTQLQRELDAKGVASEANKRQADENLRLIVEEQRRCAQIIETARELEVRIAAQRVVVNERRAKVQNDLDRVEPEKVKAEQAVKQIKDSQLGEMRNYKVPPEKVQKTLRYVFKFMKDGRDLEWDKIKTEMARPTFIRDVLAFQSAGVRPAVKEEVKREVSTWDNEAVYQSSKAAGPLADWLKAQIAYAEIKANLEPMELEVQQLTLENERKEAEIAETKRRIAEAEAKIEELKAGYAELVSKSQQLEADMKVIDAQLAKSQKLIASLGAEKDRWQAAAADFGAKFRTLLGDALLAAAFLAYLGFFDQSNRERLLSGWRARLEAARLPFQRDLSLVEYLSTPADRIAWKSCGLPTDDLCVQNAIILARCNRYPLIIDPEGQAIEFIVSLLGGTDGKLIRTSFSEEAFSKQLETALRFGLTVVVEDVERIEPVLNGVLNKEVTRQGGRVVIQVGDQIVDFNARFKLFMATRNSEARFTPDLCSRVTFVNFTLTRSSLESQFAGTFLRSERPDIEAKQLNLLRLQGEFIVQLRGLEDRLLAELSASEGSNILENEQMVLTLENLKQQAATITAEKEKSEAVLEEIEKVIAEYRPAATIASQLYFALLGLATINPMYQFALKHHAKTVRGLLERDPKLNAIPRDQYIARLRVIEAQLFACVYERVSNALHERDKLVVALRFAQIKAGALFSKALQSLLGLFGRTWAVLESTLPPTFLKGLLSQEQRLRLEGLARQPGFEGLLPAIERAIDAWTAMLRAPGERGAELVGKAVTPAAVGVTVGGSVEQTIVGLAIEALIFSALKPQVLPIVLAELAESVLGKGFLQLWRSDLASIIDEDADAKSPVLLASAAGFDPSSRLFALAKNKGQTYDDTAIGAADGFIKATNDLGRGMKVGNWVILRNVHLAASWLTEVEQQLHKVEPRPAFRLFLLSEFSTRLPPTLLRQSVKLIFELPDGIKASVRRTYATLFVQGRSDKAPTERARLHFFLAWTHAVIMERLRYVPTGWSKRYEFSEADLRCAVDVLDEFIDALGARQSLPLDAIPFTALCSVITENVYGGKVDNAFDLKVLRAIIEQFISPQSFDTKRPLVGEGEQVVLNPEGTRFEDFRAWIEGLQVIETPIWAGLPAQANDLLASAHAADCLGKLCQLQDGGENDALDVEGEDVPPSTGTAAWLQEVLAQARLYSEALPAALPHLERNSELIADPLFRFLEREWSFGDHLLKVVRGDLVHVVETLANGTSPAQTVKKTIRYLQSNTVPETWRRYIVPPSLGLAPWLTDYKSRLEQLRRLRALAEWHRKGIDIGEFFFSEALLTATQQRVAQSCGVSMDVLRLSVELAGEGEVGENAFLVRNMWIEGARWTAAGFELAEEMSQHLHNVCFTWRPASEEATPILGQGEILVPFYLNSTRRTLLASIKMPITNPNISVKQLYQRGLALIAWKL